MQQIGEAITEVTTIIVQQSEVKIQALDAEIQAKQEQVDIEMERDKAGYANNLLLRKQELEDLKAQKAKEQEVRRNGLKVQQALDTASTISNAAMTVSNGITFLTRLAAEEIKLGPIAGPIAFFGTLAAMTATIFASVAKIRALSQSTTQMRAGGKLRGPRHEQGGIRGTGSFSDIEVEGDEHVTNARSSTKYDKTLEALNVDDPHKAVAALVREGKIGLPGLIITHINQPSFSAQQQVQDMSSLTAKMNEHTAKLDEHIVLTRDVVKHLFTLSRRKERTMLANGVYVEQDGNKTSYVDDRERLKKMGTKVN